MMHFNQVMTTAAMHGMEPKPWGRSGLYCHVLISP